ncbi:dihydropteroate synthase [Tabrizicola sp.]|uniref:dihydropteroate synthase n=1 Tax=Tabrizicola sp. TaxID=2005166 RepID=UPI0026328B19|nr:dihydropteroate synthase [Tabrizicola sp.]MDM7932387.1 dihydropteroate synthase [Tabrizicola sp.]
MDYFRPIAMTDAARPAGALTLAGGWCWFDRVEVLSRSAAPRLIPAADCPPEVLRRLTGRRPAFAGLTMERPRLMGILNVTPDSFSDGGRFVAASAALTQGCQIAKAAEIVDIGGESTRPGAVEVQVADEIARTVPVIEALRKAGVQGPISIDTRKAPVAAAALTAGATLVNDVSALGFDPALGPLVAREGVPVVLMHAQGAPATMQDDPNYGNVLLDVYDALAARVAAAVALGIDQETIAVDPGIGFGKTAAHNLALIRGLSLLHGLGCPILLGASRKRFIGSIGGADLAEARMPGSLAVALSGFAQGVQITRVHDVAETRQALLLWQAMQGEPQEVLA